MITDFSGRDSPGHSEYGTHFRTKGGNGIADT